MSDLLASTVRTTLAITALALALTAVPATAAEEVFVSSIVAGEIVLPEDSPPLTDGTILVTVEDSRRADATPVVLASLTMDGSGAESPIPFALSVVPAVLEASDVIGPLDILVQVRIESPDGSLLYIADSTIAAVTPSGPITDLEIPVIAADAD